MATIVLVHGIAQEQLGPETLYREWVPALADGVNKYGNTKLAHRIWHHGSPGDIAVQMAYYATAFLRDDPLDDDNPDLDNTPLPPNTNEELVARFAHEVLHAAAEAASDHADRATAENQITALSGAAGDAQGMRALGRPLLDSLSRLRWFASPTMRLAGRTVWRTVTQLSRYLSDDAVRAYAQQQVLDLIDADTKLVIGHSLGSVVAYEALHRSDYPAALITLGSPLGLRSIVYERLRPQPPHVPPQVTTWYNFADKDDLVAARLDLAPDFPPAPNSHVKLISPPPVDNGRNAHNIVHYLTKTSCGEAVSKTISAH